MEIKVIFEGSEKKFEAVIQSEQSLLNIEDKFWRDLVKQAKATVLSSVKNEHMKAFLLSESSLFVWHDRILLITCGQTSLVNAIDFLIKHFGKESIGSLIFQRKNEYFSHLQPTSFYDDIEIIKNSLDGDSYRLGNMDDHHNFIFSTKSKIELIESDKTDELLLYDLSPEISSILTDPSLSKTRIREFLCLDQIIPDFQIDDFVFDPYGYSLNAIKDDKYFTIHITPQENSSYVSFESNIDLTDYKNTVLEVFKPGSFDHITFRTSECQLTPRNDIGNFQLKRDVNLKLELGYYMCFSHFFNKEKTTLKAFKI